MVREREIGTLEQIMVTPIGQAEFILGKTIPFFLIGLFDAALITAVGTLWFRVPLRGSLLVLLAGTVLYLFCVLGIGLLISTISANQQQAMVSAFFFLMPAIIFSGFASPISSMPIGLQCADLRRSVAIFHRHSARSISEGGWLRRAMAADGVSCGLRRTDSAGERAALPQIAGLTKCSRPAPAAPARCLRGTLLPER